MNIHAFLEAPPAVQIHAGLGIVAFLLGLYLLARRKGGTVHRRLGQTWVAIMAVVAFSALFIHQIRTWGPFSPLHLLSLATFASCWWAIRTARLRRIKAHARTMVGMYVGGVLVAGGLTFLPGLLMHRIFLSGSQVDLARLADLPVSPLVLAMALALVTFVAVATVKFSASRRSR